MFVTVVLALLLMPLEAGSADAVAKLGMKTWKQRSQGFQQVAQTPAKSWTEAMRAALIGALEKENALVGEGTELGEDFSEYYSSLIEAVAGMKDPRSANALLGSLGRGRMAADGLVALGEAAVDPAIEWLNKTNSRRIRRDTCNLLRRLTEPASGLAEPARNRIGAAMAACNP